MTSKSSVLVLGATGGIGGEVARQLRDTAWEVHALQRRASQPVEQRDGIKWIRGDALKAQDVMAAANGCSVIVHAVNPPGYRRWAELVLPMLDNTIAAASAVGATIVLPGTIYNFGPDAFPVLNEESPQHAITRKGRFGLRWSGGCWLPARTPLVCLSYGPAISSDQMRGTAGSHRGW